MNWERKLKGLGFRKQYLDDKSGWWYQLNIKNRFINKLHISVEVDRRSIIVWAEEPKNIEWQMDYTFVIVVKKLTKKNLHDVLTIFHPLQYM